MGRQITDLAIGIQDGRLLLADLSNAHEFHGISSSA
jgi:hypothetical protein